MRRLIVMLEKSYALASQVIDENRDERVLQVLAEEVSGECAEFIALWNNDYGAFDNPECVDPELAAIVKKLKGE